jgi:uncharacterized protein (TIGR02147 family)
LTLEFAGCSPALVTQVLRGKRQLTRERVISFSKLLKLTRHEAGFLDSWVESERTPTRAVQVGVAMPLGMTKKVRGQPQNHLLRDWVNLYVKDASGLKGFKVDPEVVFRLLGGIVPKRRIERSLKFLLREGFLRSTLNGDVVENVALTTTTDNVPSSKIRRFHKEALKLAMRAIDLYPVEKRRANAVVMVLDDESLEELDSLLKEFYEKFMTFAERHAGESGGLYQVLLNFAPIGGKHEH